MLVRHKPHWHRHDRCGSAVIPSLMAVAPRKTVKTEDLLPPSHGRCGATAVLVQHKPQWHRHDRRGSAMVPSLIAVAPRKTVKTANLRGGTAETLNMFKTSAVPPRVGPIRSGIAAAPPWPPCLRSRTLQPPCNREKVDWRAYGDPVAFLLRLWRCYHGATTSMAPHCCRQHRSHVRE